MELGQRLDILRMEVKWAWSENSRCQESTVNFTLSYTKPFLRCGLHPQCPSREAESLGRTTLSVRPITHRCLETERWGNDCLILVSSHLCSFCSPVTGTALILLVASVLQTVPLLWIPVHQTTPQMGKRKSKHLATPSPGYPTRVPAASYSRFSTVHTWDIQNSPLNSFFIGFAHNVFPVLMLSFQSSSRLTLGKLEALFACHTMCDLSSRIRDPTHTLCNESLNHFLRKSRS